RCGDVLSFIGLRLPALRPRLRPASAWRAAKRPQQLAVRQMYASIASMFLKHLECSACGREHEWSRLQNLCGSCSRPLFAIVDLAAANRTLTRETLLAREKSLWRYREVLPLPTDVEPVSLGECGTPLFRARKFAADAVLWIDD